MSADRKPHNLMPGLLYRCKLESCCRQKHSKGVKGVTAVFVNNDQTVHGKVNAAPPWTVWSEKTVTIVCAAYIYSFKLENRVKHSLRKCILINSMKRLMGKDSKTFFDCDNVLIY